MEWQGRGIRSRLTLCAIVCGVMMQAPDPVGAQSPVAPVLDNKLVVEPETHFIPSLRVAERYDSNVFFVPGTNLDDYVTTVSPQLRVNHRNQWVEGSIGGGATAEAYVKNPGLNYVAGNGTVNLNLDGVMNRLVQGLGLRLSDSFIYTPQPLSFTAPTSGNQIPPAFVQGIQAQRTNSFTNAAKVEASYFFSTFMGVTSTYGDRRIRFGNTIASPTGVVQGGFIDTNFQTLTSGIVRQLSPADTIFIAHQFQYATFSASDGLEGKFTTQGALARWSRLIIPGFKVTGEGGVAVISPVGNVEVLGGASLEWKGQYTTVTLSYTRTIEPSFLFVSTPLLGQAVSGEVKWKISDPLFLSIMGSYAINKSVPDNSLLQFQSYSVTPNVNYVISRTFTAMLSYTHSQYEQTISSRNFPFDRDMVQLSVIAEWK